MLGKSLAALVVVSFGSMLISGCDVDNEAETNAAIGIAANTANYMAANEADKQRTEQEIQKLRDESNTIVVNITCSDGSIRPVVLKRQGNVYIGPKGEQYLSVPTPEQLKPVYGF